MEPPKLKGSLFGYSRKRVRALLTEREMMVIKASHDARDVEAKVDGLAAELDQARVEAGELRTRIHDLESQLKDSAERFRAVERSSSPSTSEGLTEVLHAAERALARLTETARRNAEQELGQTERERDDLRSEIDRLAAWRARMAPLSEAVPRSIEDVRREASAIAGRLREALGPISDAMDVLAARLSELVEAPPAPPEIPAAAPAGVIRLEEAGAGIRPDEITQERLEAGAGPS
jgi:predicted  nucleic acid-binding Zn-ribbon protein